MRICVGNKYHSFDGSTSGKGKFALRLINEFRSMGHDVTSDHSYHSDVDLQFTHLSYKPNARKSILRYGPAEVDSSMKDYKWRNEEKWRSMKSADGIVYQSEYSKKVNDKFVGKPSVPTEIIFNGAPRTTLPAANYGRSLLASTRVWLPQKRLGEIIRGFQEFSNSDSDLLYIAGDISGNKKTKDRRVKYLGSLNDEELFGWYSLCSAMIHVVWLDACPNSVVECIMAGTPVVCNNVGGTMELVKDGVTGIVAPLDKEYDFGPVNLSEPRKINPVVLAQAIENVLAIKKPVYDERLDIKTVAKKYVDFFDRVLNG